MRPIKFRAWNKEKKVMVDLYKITPLALADDLHHQNGLYIPFDDRLELMQFTGLHDKNGKEIWEGDILTVWNYLNGKPWDGHVHNCIVEAVPGGWELKDHWSHESLRSSELEVIGNIHENPEFLK